MITLTRGGMNALTDQDKFVVVYSDGIRNKWNDGRQLQQAGAMRENVDDVGFIAALLSENLSVICKPSRSISVVLITGTADPLVPYQGGEIRLFNIKRGKGLPSDATTQFWVNRNQCSNAPSVSSDPIRDSQDVTRVGKQVYAPCRERSAVIRYIIASGGHTWSNGWQYLPELVVGKTTHQLDGNVALGILQATQT